MPAGDEVGHIPNLLDAGEIAPGADGACPPALIDELDELRLQDRLGHATPNMALAYQRVAQDRPRQIAEALSRMAATQE